MSNVDDILGFVQPRGAFINKSVGSLHEFYVTGEIGDSSYYLEWFDVIRNTTKNDTVKIYINSYGGDMFTAVQFMRVLNDCDATVVISVEGACMSAATLIMMCGHVYEISDHSAFMFHNYSGGSMGKGHEMMAQLDFEQRWSEGVWRDAYFEFLSDDEIDSILDGKDIWLESFEVIERLESKAAALAKLLDDSDKPVDCFDVKKDESFGLNETTGLFEEKDEPVEVKRTTKKEIKGEL
tara:strand:+ start:575 stop:1288 length:714 start_codon:yes stop_codon:yes gene_type:complete